MVNSLPILQVSYANVVLPLAELEAQQFPLVQSCVFPKLVSTSEDVRKASTEAERRIDAHVSACRFDNKYLVLFKGLFSAILASPDFGGMKAGMTSFSVDAPFCFVSREESFSWSLSTFKPLHQRGP